MEPRDDKAACLDLAQKIEDDVQIARKHRIVNTCLQIVLMLMVGTNFWRSLVISKTMQESFIQIAGNDRRIMEIQARQDVYRQQYLDYIKDTIHAMQKFQDENPQLKVPKAPTPRLPGDEGSRELELQQIPQVKTILAPTATPTVRTKTVIKYKVRPTPKPKPKHNWWESIR